MQESLLLSCKFFSMMKEATGYMEIVIVAIFPDSRILQKNIHRTILKDVLH